MLVRTEAPADILPIDHLLRSSLGLEERANTVLATREQGRITLSLVACRDDGEIVGYALFTSLQPDGDYVYWQHLTVLVTHPDFQYTAEMLVRDGLNMLLELGYPACSVCGAYEDYQRLGFESARRLNISINQGIDENNFLVFELTEGTINSCSGVLHLEFTQDIFNDCQI